MSDFYRIGPVGFKATGDRIIALEDEFRSGYECRTCKGKGIMACYACEGSGRSTVVPGARCNACEGSMTLSCIDCGGKGGVLVVPDNAQRRPTTGTVVSAGPECKVISQGQSIMYSNFCGHAIDLSGSNLRILHETEVLCLIDGHLEMRDLKEKKDMTAGG